MIKMQSTERVADSVSHKGRRLAVLCEPTVSDLIRYQTQLCSEGLKLPAMITTTRSVQQVDTRRPFSGTFASSVGIRLSY